jgi:hypothetical protein
MLEIYTPELHDGSEPPNLRTPLGAESLHLTIDLAAQPVTRRAVNLAVGQQSRS